MGVRGSSPLSSTTHIQTYMSVFYLSKNIIIKQYFIIILTLIKLYTIILFMSKNHNDMASQAIFETTYEYNKSIEEVIKSIQK